MRTVTYKLADLKKVVINLGKVAENDATQVRIDAAEVFEDYPAAQVALSVTNPVGETYPATVQRDGDFVVWDVKDSSLTAEGDGEIQISFSQSGAKIRSEVGKTKICRSIVADGEAPDPVQDWVDHAEEVLEEIEDAIPGGGTTGQVLAKASDEDYDLEWVDQTGGGGGTSDYNQLENRPQIGGVTLTGNKSLHDLGAAAESDIPDVSGFYTKPAGGIPASDLADGVIPDVSGFYTKPSGGIPASDIADGVIPDPEDLIDDTAGEGDTDKTWSADKLTSDVLSAINVLEPSASASDVGKMLKVKTVADGKVAEYEFGEGGGGGSVDPQDIADAVADWCDENITEDPTVVIDKSLLVSGAAADAKVTGEVRDVVLSSSDVDLMANAPTQDIRIKASDGSTDANGNWKAYIIDVDDIDETLTAKMYSSDNSRANVAYYTSKTTLSAETSVGTPIAASVSNSYLEIGYSDLNIPQTAVCVVFCNRISGTEAYIKKQIKTTKVYSKEETDEQIASAVGEISEEVGEVLDAFYEEIDVNLMGTATRKDVRISASDGSTQDNANWHGYLLDVEEIDDNFTAKLFSNNTSYAVCAFYSSKTTFSSSTCVGTPIGVDTQSTYKILTKNDLTIPDTAVCALFVNNQNGTEAYIKTKIKVKKAGTGGRFTILSANCNGFPDGGSAEYPLTTEEYRTHWRTLLNDSRIDFMAISEYNDGTFGEETVQQALFADSMPFFKYITDGVGQATACRMSETLFVDKLEVTSSITYDGATYTTPDKYVMKTEVFINGVSVMIYSIKLCPSGADPTPTKLAWTKAMRQAQYQDILDDIEANGYTHYIICGDFNAQDCSQDNEYQIFLNAGLTICNGGYLGWFSTLRNINADNIIFPSTIRLVQFKVLNSYTLNTDHYPIVAELQVNPA